MDTDADNSIQKLTITFDDALGDVGNGTLKYSQPGRNIHSTGLNKCINPFYESQ